MKKIKEKINPYSTFDETTMEFVNEDEAIEAVLGFDSYIEHRSDIINLNERKYYE